MKLIKSERGQVALLLALGIIGLIGFTALAIDGGMVYSDRRIAQNAADAASLAGIGKAAQELQLVLHKDWDCSSDQFVQAQADARVAAQNRAASNDFIIDQDISDSNGVVTSCVDGGSFGNKYIDVRVLITTETPTSFAHFVYQGPLVNTVEAVGRLYPRIPAGLGNSIISLTENCQGTEKGTVVGVGTNGNVDVTGGGIFSHSCLILNGSSGTISADSISYMKDYTNNGGMDISPDPPTKANDKLDIDVPEPDCSVYTSYTNVPGGKDVTLKPGKYKGISVPTGDLTMEEGLYCVEGDFSVTGGSLTGIYVTIHVSGKNSSFRTGGNTLVKLSAPPADCDKTRPDLCPDAVPGLLLYMDEGTKDVTITGTSGSYYYGTIYAPKNVITVSGTSEVNSITLGTQFIGDTIKIDGGAGIQIHYDEAVLVHDFAKFNLNR